MNPAQLITELEKRGVLTWEVGDVAKVVSDRNKGHEFVVRWNDGYWLCDRNDEDDYRQTDCTHSADDPRLLGRVLMALGNDMYFDSIEKYGRFWRVNIDGMIYEGDTLIEVVLKALLAKISTKGEE